MEQQSSAEMVGAGQKDTAPGVLRSVAWKAGRVSESG